MKRRILLIALLVACGCRPQGNQHSATTRPLKQSAAAPPEPPNPFLPILQPQQVTIWQITVPLASVSANEAFWANVDETTIDPAEHAMLYKNGLRIGQVASDDWETLKKSLSNYHAKSQRHQFTGAAAQTAELVMRTGVVSESLFYFDRSSHLAGRTFDNCDNILSISFEPAPANPQTTHVAIHPLVRSQRTEIQFSKLNTPSEFPYVHPEHLYDLALQVDVPRDHFLVVGASPEIRSETSLGRAFLTHDDQPEQTETLLLILPAGFEALPDQKK